MSWGVLIEAEYESGLVLREGPEDMSPYDLGKNFFHAVLTSRATDHGHGRMTLYAAVTPEHTWTIEWRELWNVVDPRPISYRKMENAKTFSAVDGTPVGNVEGVQSCAGHFFGYQYRDGDGKNVQEVQELIVMT